MMETLYDEGSVTVCGYGDDVYALTDTRRKPLFGHISDIPRYQQHYMNIIDASLRMGLDSSRMEILLDERVPDWREEIFEKNYPPGYIPQGFKRDLVCLSKLEKSLFSDVKKIKNLYSSGRGFIADFIGGAAQLRERSSFEIEGLEYDSGIVASHSYDFYQPDKLANDCGAFFIENGPLVKEYEQIFRNCGAYQGETLAGMINDGAKNLFSGKGEPVKNAAEVIPGETYGFIEYGRFFIAEATKVSILEPPKGRKVSVLKGNCPKQKETMYVRIKNSAAESYVDYDTHKFRNACLDDLDPKICSALVDGKGNIIGSNNHGTIYNMPEVSDQLTGLSELRKDYDLRKSRLEGIEKENNPWDKIETSQKSLKQFVL